MKHTAHSATPPTPGWGAPAWRSHYPWGLWLLLLSLHLHSQVHSPWAQALWLCHAGLMVLWQPLWRLEGRIRWRGMLLLGAGLLAAMRWSSPWALVLLQVLLVAVGLSQSFAGRLQWLQRWHLLACSELLMSLLLVVFPSALQQSDVLHYTAPLLHWLFWPYWLLMLFLPLEIPRRTQAPQSDALGSLLIGMMLTLLLLGCIALMHLQALAYPQAMLLMLLFLAGGLLTLAWAWSPRWGLSGLGVWWSAHVLQLGTPFALWTQKLARLVHSPITAEAFLQAALQGLMQETGAHGLRWHLGEHQGELGEAAGPQDRSMAMVLPPLHLTLHCKRLPSGSLMLHWQHLARMVLEFYLSKTREQALSQAAAMKAIHHTGAQLTHDIKNILQSLHTLCAIAADDAGDAQSQRQLLARQLPHLAQRLEQTLAAMQAGRAQHQHQHEHLRLPAGRWWQGMQQQYQAFQVQWPASKVRDEDEVPVALFERTLEHLLANALGKRINQPDLIITARLEWQEGGVALEVEDNGSAVPASVCAQLFQQPVQSSDGMGIGLLQTAEAARLAGYELSLTHNQPGRVSFRLQPVMGKRA